MKSKMMSPDIKQRKSLSKSGVEIRIFLLRSMDLQSMDLQIGTSCSIYEIHRHLERHMLSAECWALSADFRSERSAKETLGNW